MANYIVIAIILLVVILAIRYIINQKKKGAHCIGCPYSGQCEGKCNCDDKKV